MGLPQVKTCVTNYLPYSHITQGISCYIPSHFTYSIVWAWIFCLYYNMSSMFYAHRNAQFLLISVRVVLDKIDWLPLHGHQVEFGTNTHLWQKSCPYKKGASFSFPQSLAPWFSGKKITVITFRIFSSWSKKSFYNSLNSKSFHWKWSSKYNDQYYRKCRPTFTVEIYM